MSDVNGPKCCRGCGHILNSFHKCILCQGRVRAGIGFVGDGEEGVNGTCKVCAKGRGADAGKERVDCNEKIDFRVERLFVGTQQTHSKFLLT